MGEDTESDGNRSEPDNETFNLQLIRHSNGSTSIQVEIPDFGGGHAEEDSSTSQISDSGESKSESATQSHSVSSSPSDRFDRLTRRWVTVSVAFFENIPKLVDQNFTSAQEEVLDRVRLIAEQRSTDKEVIKDKDTAIENYTLSLDELSMVSKALGRSTQAIRAVNMMNRSTLSALVSEYEGFLANAMRVAGEIQPSAFVSNADTISLGELEKFASLEEVKKEVVSSKIDDLLHSNSHVQVLRLLGEKFGLNLTSADKLLAEFTEICQRRHLLTHAGGVVNRRYLRICEEGGCDLAKLPKLGEKVEIDRKYIRRATARVFQIGYFSIHMLWQKLIPTDHERSCGAILAASHDFLENDLTKMTRRLVDFVLESKRLPSEKHQAYLTINKALSFLFDPNLEDDEKVRGVDETLRKRDWTVISPTLKLALACVRQEYDNIEALAEAASRDGIGYTEANTWAVFREVRERPDFISKFKN